MAIGQREIREVVRGIWDSVLGWEIEPTTTPPEPARGNGAFRIGFIQIAGAWEGAIVCVCSDELVRSAAATMFGINPDALTVELLHDALGELTNMIGGNLKALLPGPSFLCLPAVVEGSDYSVCVPATRCVVEATFACQQHPFTVRLLAGGPASASKERSKISRQFGD